MLIKCPRPSTCQDWILAAARGNPGTGRTFLTPPPELVRSPPSPPPPAVALHPYATSWPRADAFTSPHRKPFSGQIAICTFPLSRQRGVTILLGPVSS